MDYNEIKYILVALAVCVVYWIWEWKKENISEFIRKIVYWVCYLVAILIFLFGFNLITKILVAMFSPFMSCILIFGRWKRWDSFKDFLMDYYQSDGLWLLSLFIVVFQIVL